MTEIVEEETAGISTPVDNDSVLDTNAAMDTMVNDDDKEVEEDFGDFVEPETTVESTIKEESLPKEGGSAVPPLTSETDWRASSSSNGGGNLADSQSSGKSVVMNSSMEELGEDPFESIEMSVTDETNDSQVPLEQPQEGQADVISEDLQNRGSFGMGKDTPNVNSVDEEEEDAFGDFDEAPLETAAVDEPNEVGGGSLEISEEPRDSLVSLASNEIQSLDGQSGEQSPVECAEETSTEIVQERSSSPMVKDVEHDVQSDAQANAVTPVESSPDDNVPEEADFDASFGGFEAAPSEEDAAPSPDIASDAHESSAMNREPETDEQASSSLNEQDGAAVVEEDNNDDFGGFEEATPSAAVADSDDFEGDDDDDDDFGGFEEAAPTSAVTDSDDFEDDDDFGDFDSAPQTITELDEPQMVKADDDDDDDFGEFSSVDAAEAAATTADAEPSQPVDTRRTSQVARDGEAATERARMVFASVFGKHLPKKDDADSSTDFDEQESRDIPVESILSSIREARKGVASSLDHGEYLTYLKEEQGRLKEAPSRTTVVGEGKGPFAHFSIPVGGIGTLDLFSKMAKRETRRLSTPPFSEVYDVRLPSVDEEPPDMASPPSAPRERVQSPTMVELPEPPAFTKKKPTAVGTAGKNGQQDRRGSSTSSEKVEEFLKKIPDLSYMLSSKLQ